MHCIKNNNVQKSISCIIIKKPKPTLKLSRLELWQPYILEPLQTLISAREIIEALKSPSSQLCSHN